MTDAGGFYTTRGHTSKYALPFYLLSFGNAHEQRRWWWASPKLQFGLACLLALATSAAFPAVDLTYGVWTDRITARDATPQSIRSASQRAGCVVFGVGVVQLLLTWASMLLFMLAANALTERLALAYVASVLAQDTQWFGRHGTGEICAGISIHLEAIRAGFGDKLWNVANGFGVLIGSTILAFVRSPSVAGVLFPIIPLTFALFALLALISDKVGAPTLALQAQVATFMEQMLHSIRTVHAFGAAEALMLRLSTSLLAPLQRQTRKRAIVRALELSSVYAVMMWNYSAFFAWGAHQIAARHVAIGPATTSFWSFINAFFTFANIVPHLGSILKALASLRALRQIIESQPPPTLDRGKRRPDSTLVQPSYRFDKVSFSYPSRPHTLSLDNVSFRVEPNSFTAFVGPSGSGKSTILSLLLREFELPDAVQSIAEPAEAAPDVEKAGQPRPNRGEILFGTDNLGSLDMDWYRSHVAVVSQSLHLLPGTILDNLETGLSDRQRHELRQLSEPERQSQLRAMASVALRKAQAYEFVARLPDGVDTCISNESASANVSGGQRQRLALARALMRDFTILLLDEATSALDSETEEAIRVALERERRQRPITCCVVAHRLSTIQHADKIVVLVQGRVVDQGTHQELMHPDRSDQTYRSMFLRQRGQSVEDKPSSSSSHPTDLKDSGVTDHPLACCDSESTLNVSQVDANEKLGLKHPSARLGPVFEQDELHIPHSSAIPPASSKPVAVKEDTPPIALRNKLGMMWNHTAGTRLLFLLGCLAAVAASLTFPISGFITGKGVASLAAHDPSQVQKHGYFWSLMLFVLGVVNAVLYTLQGFCLEDASATLATTIQQHSLQALMRQSLTAIELGGQGAGALAASLSVHPGNIALGMGTVLGNMLISAGNFVGAIAVALTLSWKATLVTFAPIVLVIAASYVTVKQLQLAESRLATRSQRCTDFLAPRIDAIRTIAALGQQEAVLDAYASRARLRKEESIVRPLLWGSLGFAVGQSFVLLPSALGFYWSGTLFSRHEISLYAVYGVFELQLITGFAASRLTTFVPDLARSFMSLDVVCGWFARKPEHHGCTGNHNDQVGDIVLSNVRHAYPQRPEQSVLQHIDMTIRRGSTIALVGTSGSGKSSLLALLSRFYDPVEGKIQAGQVDLPDWDLQALRGRMALVSQDAALFQGSIRWNVMLGATRSQSQITEDEVRSACEQADILEFIDSLPEGLDTDVGMHGSQLSGGQRQRLCIARALLRDPEVLLLDEATSALDAQSEAVVQETLSRASQGRTAVIVAHRLSTIRSADIIYVLEDGRIVESGSHAQLMQSESRYKQVSDSGATIAMRARN